MKKSIIYLILLILIPFIVAMLDAIYMKSLWMTLSTVFIIFLLVSVVPFCARRENLYVFILTAFVSIPANYFLLTEYAFWMNIFGANRGLLYVLCMIEQILVLSSIEEIIMGFLARILWKKQYRIFPEE